MLVKNYYCDYVNDLEMEAFNNSVIKEGIEIALDEIAYFFDGRERLIDIFNEGVQSGILSPASLTERFHKIFYAPEDIQAFICRLEKRVARELDKVAFQTSFTLKNKTQSALNVEGHFHFIVEEANAYRLSNITAKAIDTLWKRSSCGIISGHFSKIGSQFSLGEYFLATVKLSSGEIMCDIHKRLKKSIKGILKQNKIEISNFIKNEIIAYVLKAENVSTSDVLKIKKVKTA